MAGPYAPTRKDAATLLADCQSVTDDADATAVDPATGSVTTPTAWTDQQKQWWLQYWVSWNSYTIP